jgi:glutamate carboxypeptidase
MRHVSIAFAAMLAAFAGGQAVAQAKPKPNAKLLSAVEACRPEAKTLLEQVVAIDSGTGDAEGLNKVGAIYAEKLKALGAAVHNEKSAVPGGGDNVVATVTGTGKGRILLISHIDTVFSRGEIAAHKPRWEGDRYYGAGAGDDKSGGVTAICVLGALKTIGFKDFARVGLILNASEETGSWGSRDLIRKMARDVDVAINLERGVPSDKALLSRKGSGVLTVEFTGRAAHSGLEPEKGRNAALEAARVAIELAKLGDAAKGTTVTVVMLNGGDKINVVPDAAYVKADVRVKTPDEFDRVEKAAAAIAAHPGIDGVTASAKLERNFPPWARATSTEVLLARANGLYAELGRKLEGIEVGSSADSAFAAETGVPTIDGFGMEGDGAHGANDYADISTLAPRAYLLARMIMDIGHAPPKR